MSLREKLFATDFDAWNDEPSTWMVAVIGGIGGGVGFGLAGFLGFEQPLRSVVTGLVTGGAVFTGLGVLAALD